METPSSPHAPGPGAAWSMASVDEIGQTLTLHNGRRVRYLDLGARQGAPVVALHGTPGSRLRFLEAHDHAGRAGIRLIALDRWGYGGSDAPTKVDFSGYARDIGEITDQLGIERFGLLGVSGGGPYAAIAASLLGPRVTRLALISPVGPVRGRSREGIGWFHRFCFTGLPRVPVASRLIFGPYRALTRLAPGLAVALFAARAPASDRAVLSNAASRARIASAFAEGLAGGTRGARIDIELFSRSWHVDRQPMADTRLWIGARDGNVPIGAAHHLANDTGAHMIIVPQGGHLWLSTAWSEVLGWLGAPT